MKKYTIRNKEELVKKKWNSKLHRRTTEQTLYDYDEVLYTLNRDDIEIIGVFGSPPPTEKKDGSWVWRTNRIQEGLYWKIEYINKKI